MDREATALREKPSQWAPPMLPAMRLHKHMPPRACTRVKGKLGSRAIGGQAGKHVSTSGACCYEVTRHVRQTGGPGPWTGTEHIPNSMRLVPLPGRTRYVSRYRLVGIIRDAAGNMREAMK